MSRRGFCHRNAEPFVYRVLADGIRRRQTIQQVYDTWIGPVCRTLVSPMSSLEELLKRRPASRIYHYTSQAGLIGIVTNKCIWATSIHHLNDATEFDYARGIMKLVISEKPRNGGGAELSESLTKRLDGAARINLFVACFSEKPDLLSQWRAYCPNGNGYSIGFEHYQLTDQMNAQQFFLAPCIYDIAQQEKLIRELVDEAFKETLQGAKPSIDAIATECFNKFLVVGPALKHPTFTEEAEWRLVSKCPKYIYDPQIKVREGKSMLLPYFQFKLAKEDGTLPQPSIVVGPNPHMELAVLAVKFLLGSFEDVVKRTTIPFRAW
jgi:hypothetical protein